MPDTQQARVCPDLTLDEAIAVSDVLTHVRDHGPGLSQLSGPALKKIGKAILRAHDEPAPPPPAAAGSQRFPVLVCKVCGGISDGPVDAPGVCPCEGSARYEVVPMVPASDLATARAELARVQADAEGLAEAIRMFVADLGEDGEGDTRTLTRALSSHTTRSQADTGSE